jgi:hypothetical protein
MTFTPFAAQQSGVVNDAAMFGLSFWSHSPYYCNYGHQLAVNTMVCILRPAEETVTINNLGVWVGAAGVTPGAGVNGLAIYSVAGVLLGQTGDMTASFQSTGYFEGTISGGVGVTHGVYYYLALQHNFTGTAPTFPSTQAVVGVPPIRSHYNEGYIPGQTSFPASFTPSSLQVSAGSFVHFVTAGT